MKKKKRKNEARNKEVAEEKPELLVGDTAGRPGNSPITTAPGPITTLRPPPDRPADAPERGKASAAR